MAHKRQHRRNYNEPGHAHELTFSCYQGFKFLQAERTCEWLAEAIEEARVESNFDLWAYVFMPEHVHLIVRPREAEYDIAAIRMRSRLLSVAGRSSICWPKRRSGFRGLLVNEAIRRNGCSGNRVVDSTGM